MSFHRCTLRVAFSAMLAVSFPLAVFAGPDYERIFMEADRMFPPKAKMSVTMVAEKNGKESDRIGFTCYLSGSEKYLLIMEKPKILKGQIQLRLDDIIYSYSSKSNKVTKVSASSAFMNSSISQEDIMNATLARIYRVAAGSEDEIEGVPCYLIELEPKIRDAAYKKILIAVAKSSGKTVKREYYSYGNDLVKEVSLVENLGKDSGLISVQLTTTNLLNPGETTRLFFENIDAKASVPDELFDVRRLKYIN